MSEVMETLSKPVGPLPLGGWIVAVAGGVGVAVVIRRRAVDAEVADAAAVEVPGLSLNGNAGETWDTTQPGVGNTYQPDVYGYGQDDVVEAPTTNEAWRARAVTVLSQNGYDGSRANSVLGSYIAGKTLSGEDSQIVSAAIRLVGAPPDRITAAVTAKPAPATTKTGFKTNNQWREAAIKWLRQKKRLTDKEARSAVNRYLGISTNPLTASQAALILTMIGSIGEPPTKPKPKKVVADPPPKKAASRRDTGKM